ncbi:MAG: zinc ribbon domain-containing protein [Synergistes sp.]|nr:zinc ribbon domain-containing protein [Synergistes sp.]
MAFLDIEKVLSKGVSRAVEQAIKNKLLDIVSPKQPKTTSRKRTVEEEPLREPAVTQQRKRVYEEPYQQAPRISVKTTAQKNEAPSSKNVKICPSCGTLCSKKMKFCSECGAQLPEVTLYEQNAASRSTCPVCGKVVASDAKFCAECGTDLRRAAGMSKAAPAAAPVISAWPLAYAVFPAWTAGGKASLEENADGLNVSISPAGYSEYEAYRLSALDAGFRSGVIDGAGEYLWKVIDDKKYVICGGYDEKSGAVRMIFSIAE